MLINIFITPEQELACGTGIMSKALIDELSLNSDLVESHRSSRVRHHYVATDISESMMKFAEDDVAHDPLSEAVHVEWCVADMNKLPFPDGFFDCIIVLIKRSVIVSAIEY